MSQPSENPEPAYTRIQMSGPPEAIARLMAALSGVGEIIFDHRSAPDDRGDVVCTARVASLIPRLPGDAPGPMDAVVQSTLGIEPGCMPGLTEQGGAEQFEAAAASALTALDGVHSARSRLVALSPTAAR